MTGVVYWQPIVEDVVQVPVAFVHAPYKGVVDVQVTAVRTVYGEDGDALTGVQADVATVTLTGVEY